MTGARSAATVSAASFAQARIMFLDELAAGAGGYHISRSFDLAGDLDLAALDRAVRECARRHESLRTCFAVVDGELKQVVTARPPAVRMVDLCDVLADADPAAAEQVIDGLVRREAATPFNLKRAPLLRVSVIRTAARQHVLTITLHHIIADARSLAVFLGEVGELYRAYHGGVEPGLAPPPLQYADYAAWQRRRFDGGELDRHAEYWQGQVAGLVELRLRPDRPLPRRRSARAECHRVTVEPQLVDRLRRLGREENASLYMTLLAGFNVLLHRATGRDDIAVGSTASGRDRPELSGVIGIFINMLLLRTPVRADDSLRAVLRRAATVCQDGFDHQEFPFERLVALRGGARDPERHPLFQTVFQMLGGSESTLELSELRTRVRPLDRQTPVFDLLCTAAVESDGSLTVEWGYSTDVFQPDTVARLADCWLQVLRRLVADPDGLVDGFPLPTLPDLADGPGADGEAETVQTGTDPTTAPDSATAPDPAAAPDPAVGPTEQKLAQLWGELLQREDIGRRDNFFILGGHSLLALAVLSRIDEDFGVKLPLHRFFEHRTLADLAADIDAAGAPRSRVGA
ncbi:hypothetical protein KGQ20_04620 [Catenulispora sp. NF23]|uniref:condensation domain-containing protein n=1 Tax=Catenulispora pinistramenti TaxID=2705254 RepID=UPI001BA70F6C|nr:condensation domain-containing protein [Catenulispora pinistramenti]MBS2532047.1 hypothetical protein [Catenulispora pinistramenti]